MSEESRSYFAYIKRSPHWQELRARRLELNPRCQRCLSNVKLHVHHIRYRNLVDCELEDVMTLCEECHSAFHLAQSCLGWSINNAEETVALINHFQGLPLEVRREAKLERKHKIRKTRSGRKVFRHRVLEMLADFRHHRIDTDAVKKLIEDLRFLIK